MLPQSAPEQPSSDQAQCDYYEPSHVTGSLFRAPVEVERGEETSGHRGDFLRCGIQAGVTTWTV